MDGVIGKCLHVERVEKKLSLEGNGDSWEGIGERKLFGWLEDRDTFGNTEKAIWSVKREGYSQQLENMGNTSLFYRGWLIPHSQWQQISIS